MPEQPARPKTVPPKAVWNAEDGEWELGAKNARGERQARCPALAAGLFATRSQIGRRIEALLGNPFRSPARLSGWVVIWEPL